MVRQPRHDEVVGRHLAERRLRDLDGQQAGRGVASRTGRSSSTMPRIRRARSASTRMRSTRAIRMKVETPAEINEVFDGIAYEKTAAVLRMIEAYVGPDAFRQGVASYLKRFSYAQRRRRGLLERGREGHGQAGRSHPAQLRRSRRRTGAVSRDAMRRRQDHGGGSDDGTLHRRAGRTARRAQTWTLPVCFETSAGQPRCEVIERPKQTVRLNGCDNASRRSRPVFANSRQPWLLLHRVLA